MNKFLTNLGQTFSDDEKAVIKNKLENILGTDQVKMAWYPTVANNGTISWGLSAYSTSTPTPMNIKGPQGEPGENGKDGAEGISVTITNIEEEGRTHVVTFSDGKSITITDGVDGAGVAIKGTVATKANLPADAENGDAYIVTGEDGKLFVYANGWPDEGVAFTGPKGERGETPSFSFIDGETGIEIHVNDSEDPVAVIPYAKDGHSPAITTSATSTGNDIYIDGNKAFSVANGINGTNGKDGYTPSLTISSVTSTEHTAGGTELKFTYPESWQPDVVFTAWNGNDGKDWDGTTGRLIQGDFIKLTPTGDDLEISVTGDFVTSSTIVGTDQYALTTAGWAKVQGGGGLPQVYVSGDGLIGNGTEANNLALDDTIWTDKTVSAALIGQLNNDKGNSYMITVNTGTNKFVYEQIPGALAYRTNVGDNSSAYAGAILTNGGWIKTYFSADSATSAIKNDDAYTYNFNYIPMKVVTDAALTAEGQLTIVIE